jgi:peptidoglycan/xylan/chitin deacetylase (PgdA/CDA1 family)
MGRVVLAVCLALLALAGGARAQERNLIANASLAVSSGARPVDWSPDSWGDNEASFRFVPDGAQDGTGALETSMRRWKDGDAKWHFRPVAVTGGRVYDFSDAYESTAVTATIAEFRDAAGVRHWRRLGYDPKSRDWRRSEFTFAVPEDAVDLTVLHVLAAVGTLRTSHASLTPADPPSFKRGLVTLMFDDGYESVRAVARPVLKRYGFNATDFVISDELGKAAFMSHPLMTADELDELARDGDEIESHTATHPRLTRLPPARLEEELAGSKAALEARYPGVDSLALPYGDYGEKVLEAVKKHYAYCRTSDVGENSRFDFDPYRIRIQYVVHDTPLADVRKWLSQASKDKAWLAILYHDIGGAKSDAGEDDYTLTPEAFAAQMAAVRDSGLPVVTMRRALAEIRPQLP